MDSTPVSLLQRLRQPEPGDAWERFVDLYGPLLLYWARRSGLSEEDAADIVQEVFTRLVRELPRFSYEPGKRFRGWLFTLTRNHIRDHLRRRQMVPAGDAVEQLAAPDPVGAFAEEEYRQYLVRRALAVMQAEFEPATWQACWQFVVEGKSAAEVAATLGLSENAVYLAKFRVVHRLRRELAGLLE